MADAEGAAAAPPAPPEAEAGSSADSSATKGESSAVAPEGTTTAPEDGASASGQAGTEAPAGDTAEAPKAGPGEVVVSFVILPEAYGQTKVVKVGSTFGEIRSSLETELSIPAGSLSLMNLAGKDGSGANIQGALDDNQTLDAAGVKEGENVGIELRIRDGGDGKGGAPSSSGAGGASNQTRELQVLDAAGQATVLRLSIERENNAKAYLGGYMDKSTGVTYHHGSTQTAKDPSDPRVQAAMNKPERFHRDTQTVDPRSRKVQSTREYGTQMSRPGIYVTTEHDIVRKPFEHGPYFSSADYLALKLEKVLIIQAHTRGMFARNRCRRMLLDRELKWATEKKETEKRELEADLRHKREIQRRMHPRTYEDFRILARELEQWRVKETLRIKENRDLTPALKKEALQQLLHKETRLLQTIDKLKTQAHRQNRSIKVRKNLESMAQPKVWPQSDNETTTVHTPYTTRAKELLDLYNGLNLPLLSIDERLDVLLHVKWTVKEFDCNLTRDIVDLIDREADMLNRGRGESSFSGLRKRLANLFLQFVETPEFNPESLRFQQVSRDMIKQTATQPLSTVPIKKGLS